MITLIYLYLPYFFTVVTLITLFVMLWAFSKLKYSNRAIFYAGSIFAIMWFILNGILSCKGFYMDIKAKPPHIIFIFIPLILIISWMLTGKRRRISILLSIKTLTLIHVVRIPVELVLFQLYMEGKIPELMTFEGRNFDILSGLTAPLIYFLAFRKDSLNKTILIGWNIIALGLLINILVNAVLSVPTPFQQFGFEQPNIGVLMFPYIWLPSIIVPIVLYCHLVSLFKLLIKENLINNHN